MSGPGLTVGAISRSGKLSYFTLNWQGPWHSLCTGRRSSGFLPSLPTPTLYGRATTTVLLSAPQLTRLARRRRPETRAIITTTSRETDEDLQRMTSPWEIKEKRRRLDLHGLILIEWSCIVRKTKTLGRFSARGIGANHCV